MNRFRARLSAALFLPVSTLAACSSPPDSGSDDAGGVCAPDLAAFETDVRPHVERYCGSCHGETPNYGAPVSLLDGASLLETRADGTRLADRIAARIVDGTMPPVGMPRMPDDDADAIVQWATCGAMDAPAGSGLSSSAPPFLAPPTAPSGLEPLDFVADEHPVGPDARNEYRCFVFDADIAEERFARRFEMVFDETRVLHHVVLLRDPERRTEPGDFDCYGGGGMPPGSEYLYAWAPGQSALEFPSGGLRISPGERFIVQIHYNNGASLPDVRDSSGVRLYLGPVEGPEYGMIAIGPTDFTIPARGTATISSRCTFAEDTTFIAGMPHMHLLGEAFEQSITRAGGGREPMISLEGWSFETQLFYSLPATLRAGDSITTSCTFENPGEAPVGAGEDTEDEMCFDFLYATPPPTTRYCDEGDAERPTDVRYVPGECLPAGTATDLPLVRGTWTEASEPPALVQSSVPDGRWLMESLDYYLTNASTPIGAIDLATTYVLARGQVVTAGGTLSYDVDADNVVLTDSGVRFGGAESYSFTGAFAGGASPATLPLSCPGGGGEVELEWGIEGDVLTIGFVSENVPGSTLWPRYHFRRAP